MNKPKLIHHKKSEGNSRSTHRRTQMTLELFNELVEKELDFNLRSGSRIGGGPFRTNVSWDLRLKYFAERRARDGVKVKPSCCFLSFGNCFTNNRKVHERIMIGTKNSDRDPIMIIMFDTALSHFKNSASNVKIHKEKGGYRMKDLYSKPIGKKFADFFNLKLPKEENTAIEYFLKLHKIDLPGIKGDNYIPELMQSENL